MRTEKHRVWVNCPTCYMMIFVEDGTFGRHKCPKKVRQRIDAELDAIVDVELSTWDEDLKRFWGANDVKFTQYLIDEDKYE